MNGTKTLANFAKLHHHKFPLPPSFIITPQVYANLVNNPHETFLEITAAYHRLSKHPFHKKLASALTDHEAIVSLWELYSNRFIPEVTGESNLILAIKDLFKKSPDSLVVVQLQPPAEVRVSLNSNDVKNTLKIHHLANLFSPLELSTNQLTQVSNLASKIEQILNLPQQLVLSLHDQSIFILRSTTIEQPVDKIKNKAVEVPLGTNFKRPRHWTEFQIATPASPGLKIGHVKIINRPSDWHKVNPGDIIIGKAFNHTHQSILQKAGAIITESEDMFDHTHRYSSQKGIPHVAKVTDATINLRDGQVLMVHGTEGKIYKLG